MLDLMFIALPLFYFGWCVVNAIIAAEKNRNVLGVLFLSLVFSPLLIWLYLVAVPVATPKPQESEPDRIVVPRPTAPISQITVPAPRQSSAPDAPRRRRPFPSPGEQA